MAEQQEKIRSYKTIFLALGFYYMMNYFVGLLRWKMCYDWKRICNNYTTVLSCVPGPKKGWEFEGLKVREVFYLVPGAGALGCGIGIITHDDNCQIAVGCDMVYFPNDTHKTFVSNFVKAFSEGA